MAWVCFDCFDQRFDLALGAFQNLEKALIAIEEKTGEASAGIVSTGFPQQP